MAALVGVLFSVVDFVVMRGSAALGCLLYWPVAEERR